jgi:hypothetical protein
MPDYLDGAPKANKHAIHTTANLFVCQVCHYPTTQVADTVAFLASDRAGHLSGIVVNLG